VEEVGLRLTKEGIQWRLESGDTLEKIRQDEEEANLALDEIEGKDGVCRFGCDGYSACPFGFLTGES
jgi:hypothetical protein